MNLSNLRSSNANGLVIGITSDGDYDQLELDASGKDVDFSDPYNYFTPAVNTDLLPVTDNYERVVNGQRTTFTVEN